MFCCIGCQHLYSENAVVSAVVIIYGESVNHPKFSWTE